MLAEAKPRNRLDELADHGCHWALAATQLHAVHDVPLIRATDIAYSHPPREGESVRGWIDRIAREDTT